MVQDTKLLATNYKRSQTKSVNSISIGAGHDGSQVCTPALVLK